MSNIRYRRLTDEECIEYNLAPDRYRSYVAIDDDAGLVVSFFQLNFSYTGFDCSSCLGNCARAGLLWTRKEYRRQRIFQSLLAFATEESGIKRLYTASAGVRSNLVASTGRVSVPTGPNNTLPSGFSPREAEKRVEVMADQMALDGVVSD